MRYSYSSYSIQKTCWLSSCDPIMTRWSWHSWRGTQSWCFAIGQSHFVFCFLSLSKAAAYILNLVLISVSTVICPSDSFRTGAVPFFPYIVTKNGSTVWNKTARSPLIRCPQHLSLQLYQFERIKLLRKDADTDAMFFLFTRLCCWTIIVRVMVEACSTHERWEYIQNFGR